jgi:hypothetical protein
MSTAATSSGPGWFARTSVQAIVLGAFFFLTVPLALALVGRPDTVEPWLPIYGVTFGLTHFLITGLLYLDARNLRYFASSWTNRLVYFAIPVGILAFMDALAVVPMGRIGEAAHGFLFYFIMFANFLHVSRQSFGVLQLFKREAQASFSPTLRSLENLFFLALVTGQFVTFARGETYDGSPEVQLVIGMIVLLFALVFGLHLHALRQGASRREDWIPIAHFTLQAVAGALVVWRTGLLQVALAMHYVEYHVAVLPRFFHAPVDRASRVDRLRSWLGRLPLLFYAGLLMVAWGFWLSQRTQVYVAPDAASLPMRLLVHSLDGIFLCHFFVEAFLWKFSKPHYRDTLGPLYFARRPG